MNKSVRVPSSSFRTGDRVFVAYEESLGVVEQIPDEFSVYVRLDSDNAVVNACPEQLSNCIEPRLNLDGSVSLCRAGLGSLF